MKRRSRISDDTWKQATEMVLRGASSLYVQKELSLGSYHTALRVAHHIRESMASVTWPKLSGLKVVAADSIRDSSKNLVRLWIAAELRGADLGLIQIVRPGSKPTAAFERIASALEQDSVVLTPPGGHLAWLSERNISRRTPIETTGPTWIDTPKQNRGSWITVLQESPFRYVIVHTPIMGLKCPRKAAPGGSLFVLNPVRRRLNRLIARLIHGSPLYFYCERHRARCPKQVPV